MIITISTLKRLTSYLLFNLLFSLLLLWSTLGLAFDSFTIKDIRIEGLERISTGTVFNYLPIKVGDYFTEVVSGNVISVLFKTSLFKDISLAREGDILIVRVEERPAISKITFSGNNSIDTEDLTKALKEAGFAEGQVFNRSLLEKVEMEIQRQYFTLSKYAVQLKSVVTPLERNRISIHIEISEGVEARWLAIRPLVTTIC